MFVAGLVDKESTSYYYSESSTVCTLPSEGVEGTPSLGRETNPVTVSWCSLSRSDCGTHSHATAQLPAAAGVCWDKTEPSCLGGKGWSRSTRRQLSPTTNPILGLSLTSVYLSFPLSALYFTVCIPFWGPPLFLSPLFEAYSLERSALGLFMNTSRQWTSIVQMHYSFYETLTL